MEWKVFNRGILIDIKRREQWILTKRTEESFTKGWYLIKILFKQQTINKEKNQIPTRITLQRDLLRRLYFHFSDMMSNKNMLEMASRSYFWVKGWSTLIHCIRSLLFNMLSSEDLMLVWSLGYLASPCISRWVVEISRGGMFLAICRPLSKGGLLSAIELSDLWKFRNSWCEEGRPMSSINI